VVVVVAVAVAVAAALAVAAAVAAVVVAVVVVVVVVINTFTDADYTAIRGKRFLSVPTSEKKKSSVAPEICALLGFYAA
jgi:hypothetical protein